MAMPMLYTGSMGRKWTDEDLALAVDSSRSIAQVLTRLELKPAGGNYVTIREAIKRLELNTEHFGGQSWSKGTKQGPKRDLQEYLSNQRPISSSNLRRRLLSEGIFEYKCYSCSLTEWMGKPIPLELEHINGVHTDNSLTNLTLLCPNCHAQTPTYRGKNIGSVR